MKNFFLTLVAILMFFLMSSATSYADINTGDANSTTIIDNIINTNDFDCDCDKTPTPTPTETPPTPTPTSPPSGGGGNGGGGGGGDGRSDNLGCSTKDCSGNPTTTQAVLGASVQGLSATSGEELPFMQTLLALSSTLIGFAFFKKNG